MSDLMFVDFLNSEMYDGHGNLKDRLENPRWIRAFRRKWSFEPRGSESIEALDAYFEPQRSPAERGPAPRSRWDDSTLDRLLELRSLLRRLVETIAGGDGPRPGDVRRLDGHLQDAAFRPRIRSTGSGVELQTLPLTEQSSVTGAIALSAAEFLASGELARIKTCSNPGCRWVYFDETRNRARRWCNSDLCGNLFKVRAYRERHRPSSPGGRTRG